MVPLLQGHTNAYKTCAERSAQDSNYLAPIDDCCQDFEPHLESQIGSVFTKLFFQIPCKMIHNMIFFLKKYSLYIFFPKYFKIYLIFIKKEMCLLIMIIIKKNDFYTTTKYLRGNSILISRYNHLQKNHYVSCIVAIYTC